ncbi:MAG: hypothetical protein U5N85_06955 [Arcicella sp.]|nr:hypothetical protein [Arcicella sp.]
MKIAIYGLGKRGFTNRIKLSDQGCVVLPRERWKAGVEGVQDVMQLLAKIAFFHALDEFFVLRKAQHVACEIAVRAIDERLESAGGELGRNTLGRHAGARAS